MIQKYKFTFLSLKYMIFILSTKLLFLFSCWSVEPIARHECELEIPVDTIYIGARKDYLPQISAKSNGRAFQIMSFSNPFSFLSAKPSISDSSKIYLLSCRKPRSIFSRSNSVVEVQCGLRELRERIDSVKSTQKITEAMKLVAASKVRRAQEAVINGRPFSETLLEVLYEINEQLQEDSIDVPLTNVRPVKRVALVVITGNRGLCGGFNNLVIKKAENRIAELRNLGVDHTLISVGTMGNSYFIRRPNVEGDSFVGRGPFPTVKEAQTIADKVFSRFVSEEVDKVELLYTKFVSLISSSPVIHTLLPLSRKGKILDVNGNSIDAEEDELFRLTTKEGKLSLEREKIEREKKGFTPFLQFEQDPVQIVDAMMPLYLNSQILRALQESTASELAARMTAMTNASDNAVELKRSLSIAYNRERQAKITGDILEIVAGAEALKEQYLPLGS